MVPTLGVQTPDMRPSWAMAEGMQASSDHRGVQAASAVAASRSAFQAQGSSRSSSRALVRPETTRSSTSVSHACGSTPFSLAVATKLAGDGEADQRVGDVLLVVAARERLDDGRRDPGHRGVDRLAITHIFLRRINALPA